MNYCEIVEATEFEFNHYIHHIDEYEDMGFEFIYETEYPEDKYAAGAKDW